PAAPSPPPPAPPRISPPPSWYADMIASALSWFARKPKPMASTKPIAPIPPVVARPSPPVITRTVPPPVITLTEPYSLATRQGGIRVQSRLTDLGYLDPPADGGWGGVSQWAMQALCRDNGAAYTLDELTPAMSDLLYAAKPLPLNPGNDLAGKI